MAKQRIKTDRSSFPKEYPLRRRLLSWAISPIYFVNFFLILILFHPLLVIARLFGHRSMKFVFDRLQSALISNFCLVGAKISIKFLAPLPQAPFILVANHQSMYDIPLIVRALRGYDPMFLSKVELGKGIPSVSYCLRNMDGCALIDRKDPPGAVPKIEEFGRNALDKRYVATIFPEGTRARDGLIKPFKMTGILTLMRTMPGVPIVPAVVDGSWEMVRYNLWPVPFGIRLRLTLLPAIRLSDNTLEETAREVEASIRAQLALQRAS